MIHGDKAVIGEASTLMEDRKKLCFLSLNQSSAANEL